MNESDFSVEFQRLLAGEELADPLAFAAVEVFDEVPIYSRYGQIEFLDGLTVAERNRELVLAAVRLLDRVEDHFPAQGSDGGRIIRMVSVTDWWVDGEGGGGTCSDGTTEILTPHIWIGNVADERMRRFRVFHPRSPAASFVARIVGAAYEVFESELGEEHTWCPDRVYVAHAGLMPRSIVREGDVFGTGSD